MDRPFRIWAMGWLLAACAGSDPPSTELGRPAPDRPSTTAPAESPTEPTVPLRALEAAVDQLCVMDEQGRVECTLPGADIPVQPPGLPFAQLAVSGTWACGLTADDAHIECWGEHRHLDAAPPKGAFVDLAVSATVACGLVTSPGPLQCWGHDSDVEVPEGDYVEVAGGIGSLCARTLDGWVDCLHTSGSAADRIEGTTFAALFDGGHQPLAVTAKGEVFWLSQSSDVVAHTPVPGPFDELAYTSGAICVVTEASDLYCTPDAPDQGVAVRDVMHWAGEWWAIDAAGALLRWDRT